MLTLNESLAFLGIGLGRFRTLNIRPDHLIKPAKGESVPRWVYKYSDIAKAKKRWKEKNV
jgi:hypothetical protein